MNARFDTRRANPVAVVEGDRYEFQSLRTRVRVLSP
jgi:hypothetical protein